MLFKRKDKMNANVDWRATLAFTIECIRKNVACGLDLEKLFRLELERNFDAKIPTTMTATEWLANLGKTKSPELMVEAVRRVVAGDDPAKYGWLDMMRSKPNEFCGMVATLYVLNEKPAA